jgi:protein phosphatase
MSKDGCRAGFARPGTRFSEKFLHLSGAPVRMGNLPELTHDFKPDKLLLDDTLQGEGSQEERIRTRPRPALIFSFFPSSMNDQASETGLDIAFSTDPGNVREMNEDACSLPPAWADPGALGTLLVVADGVGGVPGGAEASRDAVGYLQTHYYAPAGPQVPGDRLNQAVQAVNALNRSSPARSTDNERLTTLVAAVIRGNELWIANVGDSRAYLCRAGAKRPRQLTQDHAGVQSHAITQAIGLVDDCQVDLYRYDWAPGDSLVLCSDGLAAVPGPELSRLALSLPAGEASAALVLLANDLDGSDNATAVVARLAPRPPRVRRAAPTRAVRPEKRDTLPARPDHEPRSAPPRGRIGWGIILGLLLGWITAALLVYAALTGGFVPNF